MIKSQSRREKLKFKWCDRPTKVKRLETTLKSLGQKYKTCEHFPKIKFCVFDEKSLMCASVKN